MEQSSATMEAQHDYFGHASATVAIKNITLLQDELDEMNHQKDFGNAFAFYHNKEEDPLELFCDLPSSPAEWSSEFLEPSMLNLADDKIDSALNNFWLSASNLTPPEQQDEASNKQLPPHALDPRFITNQNAPATTAFPPTPALSQTYQSPYSPTLSPITIPVAVAQRRRGPKAKLSSDSPEATTASTADQVPAASGRPARRSSSRTEDEKVEQRARFLERNKHAAKRCRERKKINVEERMRELREQEAKLLQLAIERDGLAEEVRLLKERIDGCGCIHSVTEGGGGGSCLAKPEVPCGTGNPEKREELIEEVRAGLDDEHDENQVGAELEPTSPLGDVEMTELAEVPAGEI